MKVLFVYPRFARHAEHHPELRQWVPMNEYLGSPSLGIAALVAATPPGWEVAYRDDRLESADTDTDADVVALSFFTPAATRGLELADAFRRRGKLVVAGGIFPTLMPDEVQPHVDALVVGEGEPVWATVLADAARGALKPRYDVGPADLDACPVPDLRPVFGAERPGSFEPDDYPLQLSRGCPLACTACALPRSMSKTLRAFPLDHVLDQLDRLEAFGKRACLTEDTSWIPGTPGRVRLTELFTKIVERGGKAPISYVGTSLPMIRMAPSSLLTLAKNAGVDMFYLVTGFDPLSRKAFGNGDPVMWKRSVEAVKKAIDHGIEPYTSFLLGGEDDEEGTVDRMLAFADEAGIRKAEFAIATPYPGTPQWFQLLDEGRILHRDWSRYNDANCVFQPRVGTPEDVEQGYLRLWREFYSGRADVLDWSKEERTIQF